MCIFLCIYNSKNIKRYLISIIKYYSIHEDVSTFGSNIIQLRSGSNIIVIGIMILNEFVLLYFDKHQRHYKIEF